MDAYKALSCLQVLSKFFVLLLMRAWYGTTGSHGDGGQGSNFLRPLISLSVTQN